jgi:F-type H+-transporting ATPase subunit a
MGLEFLARIRRTSLAATALVAIFAAVDFSYVVGLAVAAGALWSLANLRLLEALVTSLTGGAHAPRRALLAGLANVALLVVGGVLLAKLPPLALAAGFTIPFAVLVLKTASSVLLASRFWARLVRSPWQAAALVLVLVAAAWTGGGALARARAATHASAPHATEAAAPADGGHETATAAEAPAGAAGEHAGAGEAKETGPKEFDNLVTLLVKTNEDKPWAHVVEKFENVIFSFLVALGLCVVAFLATRNFRMIPGGLQNAVEALVEPVYNQIVDILGPKYGPRYVPFLGSLFLYILFMNLVGIVPLMKSPTSNLNVTFALAITVFVYVQYTAIRENGILGWLDHMAGNPRSAIEWGLVPLAFPIHVIGELAKPVSLSCRLFGNIFGEDMLLVGFATLGIGAMSAMHLGGLPFGLPLHFMFLFLALLTSFVQALVFAMLSTIYFLLMLPHDHDHGHDPGHGHAEEAHHPAH